MKEDHKETIDRTYAPREEDATSWFRDRVREGDIH